MIKLKENLNFSVGPVEMDEDIQEVGSHKIPYFRTSEFSNLNKENEDLIKKFVYADDKARAVFLTASGTGAMEAAVMNSFDENDKVLVVNGGSFGGRFKEICEIHNINHEEIKLSSGKKLTEEDLSKFKGKGFTGFLINVHETSTGVYYDMELVSKFCKEENLFLVVDAISSFLADEYYMDKWGVNITILSSQKGLALPPGISILVLDEKGVNRVNKSKCRSLYFNLRKYLEDGLRGQTPFTPAVGILIQLNYRLSKIDEKGIEYYLNYTKEIAEDFRSKIKDLPFKIASESLSNTVTPLKPLGKMKAHDIFEYIEKNYDIHICPNGGALRDTLFRVGHIGNLSKEDNDKLIEAFKDMKEGGILWEF